MKAAKKIMDKLREKDKIREDEINLLRTKLHTDNETLASMREELEKLKLKHTPMINEGSMVRENMHMANTAETKHSIYPI